MADEWDKVMQEHFDKLRDELTEVIKTRTDALSKQAEENQNRLSESFKVGMEKLHEQVKAAAEGWGGSLDGIKRSLDDLNATVGTRLGDRDKVLANHAGRIETLERRGAV